MKIRWGLIGAGDIANKRVAAAIQSDANSELVAVCRRDEAELIRFADHFAVPDRYTDASALIASPDLDAIYIATPVDLHCRQTIASAQAGKHVLVEKPMAIDPEQCQQMIDACDQADVHLGVAYYRRFYPAVTRIQQLIASGQLGRILSMSCVTGLATQFPADDWRVVSSRGGGGPLMDIGSHRLDLFLHLLGDVDSVQANLMSSPDHEAEQAATVLVQFRSGAHGVLQCYFGAANVPDRMEIIGTAGRVTMEQLNHGEMSLWNANRQVSESHPPAENLHSPLIEDFTRAILTNQPPTVTGRIGKQTNDIIQAAYASGYEAMSIRSRSTSDY